MAATASRDRPPDHRLCEIDRDDRMLASFQHHASSHRGEPPGPDSGVCHSRLISMEERCSSYERSRMAITDVQLVHVDRILRERGIRTGEEFLKVLDDRTPVRSFFKWRWDTHARTTGNVPDSFSHDRDCFLEQLS